MSESPYPRHAYCRCGHTFGDHRRWGRRPECAAVLKNNRTCPCAAFEYDPEGCAESKRLTPREQRERLTDDGRAFLASVTYPELRAAIEEAGANARCATRVHAAIVEARPVHDLAAIKRRANVGRLTWATLLAVLRRRRFVATEQPSCPHCGRALER